MQKEPHDETPRAGTKPIAPGNLRVREPRVVGDAMRTVFALLGLTRYALANIFMSRDERRRVRGQSELASLSALVTAARSLIAPVALSFASDVRAIGILCAIGFRNLLHDAKAAVAKVRPRI
jgi:hypothetical protein